MARVNYVQTKTPTWMQAVWDLLAAELVAHGSYSLVETVNSPGGMPCAVYKCSGPTSPLGRDWYLAVARVAANPGSLYVAVAEGYDSATKSLIRPAPGTAYNSTVPATDGSYGGGVGYPIWTGTTGSTLNNVDIRWQLFGPASAAVVDCWTVVSRKGIYSWGHAPGRSASLNFGTYVGWVEPLQASDPGILVVGDYLNRTLTTDSGSMVTTRHPTITTATVATWQWMSPSNSAAAWTPSTGLVNGRGDRLFNGRPVGGRRLLRTNIDPAVYGDFRGLYPDLLNISTSGGGTASDSVLPGEMMTIYDQAGAGSTYIYCYRYGSSSNELWVNTTPP